MKKHRVVVEVSFTRDVTAKEATDWVMFAMARDDFALQQRTRAGIVKIKTSFKQGERVIRHEAKKLAHEHLKKRQSA